MSNWHAITALDEAVDRTKKLLFPINRGFWLRLAVVALLVGGVGGMNLRVFEKFDQKEWNPAIAGVFLLVFAVVLVFAVIMMYISSVFSFVYVDSLVSGRLKLFEQFRAQAGNGLRLFFLEAAAIILLVVAVLACVLSVFSLFPKAPTGFMLFFVISIALLLVIAVVTVFLIGFWLLKEFAVPIHYRRGRGIIPAFVESVKLASAQFWQFSVFSLLGLALGIASMIVTLVISLPLTMVVAMIELAFFFTVLFALELNLITFIAIVAGLFLIFLLNLAVSYIVAVITLPISVFFRYFSLVFLDKIDPSLNLLSEAGAEEAAADGGTPRGSVKVY